MSRSQIGITAAVILTLAVSMYFNVRMNYKLGAVVFERKQECQNYSASLRDSFKEYETDIQYVTLDEIFYSPKAESCLYVSKHMYLPGEGLESSVSWYLADALTQEEIADASQRASDPTSEEQVAEFERVVESYK